MLVAVEFTNSSCRLFDGAKLLAPAAEVVWNLACVCKKLGKQRDGSSLCHDFQA
jgi:hypothetical protein